MVARPNAALAQIHTQIMWSRLIAVVEEQAQTMLRTAFSTSVREAGDLSAGVFDPDTGEFVAVPIFWRQDLAPGARIAGPAVIAEDETSTVVSPHFDARIDRFGYIELTRRD